MVELLMTDQEKKRQEIREKVRELYLELKKRYPNANENRRFMTIARELNLTVPGVRGILIRMGLYETHRQYNKRV